MMRLGVLDLRHPQWAIALAPHAETLGYHRYWLAEHHGHPEQSGSPEVLAAVIAAITTRMRVGTAGVLLRYYSAYKVAQSMRVLGDVYPRRIDVGVARGAGGDEDVSALLLDGRPSSQSLYEAKVEELAGYLRGGGGEQTQAPTLLHSNAPAGEFWVLGATQRTALLAARLGASFGYSEYFARMVDPDVDGAAVLRTYREAFVPAGAHAAGAGPSVPHCNVALAGAVVERADARPALMPLAGPPALVGTVAQWRARLREAVDRYETDDLVFLDLCERFVEHRRSHELLAEAADLPQGP